MTLLHVFEQKPSDFSPAAHIAACYLTYQEQILLLQQSPLKLDPGKWGVPAGKIQPSEDPQRGAQRELHEETGLSFALSSFQPLGCLYMRRSTVDYIFHLFALELPSLLPITLSSEHQAFQWFPFLEKNHISWMTGGLEGFSHYLKRRACPL